MMSFKTSCMHVLKEWVHCMGRTVKHLYIRSFIMSRFLHDLRRPSLRCQCGGYSLDARDNGFEFH
jgi:hypothetical protein